MKWFAWAIPVLMVTGAWAGAAWGESAVKVTALRVEHEGTPIGIGAAVPRFSWKLQSDVRGEVQTAYEIRAARRAEELNAQAGAGGGGAFLWDSGKVMSDQSVLVAWGGKPLASRDHVEWQVRVWDKDGQPSAWSAASALEMGLLNPEAEWKGQWITADLPRVDINKDTLAKANWISGGVGATPVQPVGVRTVVEVPAGVKVLSATVDAAADGLVTLYVNGVATRQGSSSHTAPFHAEIPTELKAGRNVVALGSGAVRLAQPGARGRNAIAAHVSVALDNGERLEVDTDEKWKGNILAAPVGRGGPAGAASVPEWARAEFDDAAWTAAKVMEPYAAAAPRPSADGTLGPGRYLRKVFTAKAGLVKARLYSTALGTYEASINGKPINDHQLDPGWTDYAKRVMVQTTDVTGLIAPGQNVVGAVLTDGWFCGRVGWAGLAQYASIANHPSFAAQLELTYADGSVETIATDNTWKGGAGAIVGSDQQLGEIVDARLSAGWDGNGFDDSTWKAALVETRRVPLVPQVGPPVRKVMELKPVKITAMGGTWLVDFGQNMVGHVKLTARGGEGQRVMVTHGEMLNKEGTLYTENLRPAISLDTFIFKGGAGGETLEPHFTFHGFRYAQVAGYAGPLSAEDIRAVVVSSDTPQTGTFESSSAEINRLYQNIVWGQRSNFISVPTDCPQRDERMGWMGDAQVFSPTAARNADVAGFFEKWITDINDDQSAQGAFNNVNPKGTQVQSYAVWGDAGVIIPWVMYTTYGDKTYLERSYSNMARWVDYSTRQFPNLMPTGGVGDHLAPAAARGGAPGGRGGPGGVSTTVVVNTAFLAHSADLVSKSAALLGKADDAEKYAGVFNRVKETFNKNFVQADGTMAAGTQTTYVLALQFDLLPENLKAMAAKHLTDDITARAHLSTGFVGVGRINPALTDIGRSDLAYQLLFTDTYPSWLFTVKQGATTMWERWDGYTPERGFQDSSMNSFNHYSFGAVGSWLYSGAAGIVLDEASPGYKKFMLKPQFTDRLTYVRGSIDSPYGVIASHWHVEGDRVAYDVTVPANASAQMELPEKPMGITESGNEILAMKELKVAYSGDPKWHFCSVTLPAGTYHFSLPKAVLGK